MSSVRRVCTPCSQASEGLGICRRCGSEFCRHNKKHRHRKADTRLARARVQQEEDRKEG